MKKEERAIELLKVIDRNPPLIKGRFNELKCFYCGVFMELEDHKLDCFINKVRRLLNEYI